MTASGRLFRKYAVAFAGVVTAMLLASGAVELVSSYHDSEAALAALGQEKAATVTLRIEHYIGSIVEQIGWIMLPSPEEPAATLSRQRFELRKLLRQVPAITDISRLDRFGREQLRVSRLDLDVVGSQRDFSREPMYREALSGVTYYGPVYFRKGTEPYMTIAIAPRPEDTGVAIAEVNLKLIWDVVSQLRLGRSGYAYVVDSRGRLIAHPDLSLVLRHSDFSALTQVRAALASRDAARGARSEPSLARDINGRTVLTASAPIPALGWSVFVEQPQAEAFAALYASLRDTGLMLLLGLLLALASSLLLARRMVRPIRALQASAAQIGAGALDHRIEISTGDELEALGDQFNRMAARLQDSYATLERKVAERTHELALANDAKSRFLATASHDLRQPLHALGLFVAQLRAETDPAERRRLVTRIDAAVAAMDDLFNALLDISKLDAGALAPELSAFPIDLLLRRIEANFAGTARAKGLRLRIAASPAWVASDRLLLERILLNLVSNAVRYTARGGVVVGCRRRGRRLRIEVWDTGCGIPADQRQKIFGEFYRLAGPAADGSGGLGLGLAIVERLCRLLDHAIELDSTPGKGSRFAVLVPLAAPGREVDEPSALLQHAIDPLRGKLVVVIDDDAMVLESMSGMLRRWGCIVVAGSSAGAALAALAAHARTPDLVVSDCHLADGDTGFAAIQRLRGAFPEPIPAFLVSGDTGPERRSEARASGYHLLHKPVPPITLRAMLNQLLKDPRAG